MFEKIIQYIYWNENIKNLILICKKELKLKVLNKKVIQYLTILINNNTNFIVNDLKRQNIQITDTNIKEIIKVVNHNIIQKI